MKEITGINHLGLRIKSLDVSRTFYEKLGFEFIVGPVTTPDGASFIFVRDPDDNVIDIS